MTGTVLPPPVERDGPPWQLVGQRLAFGLTPLTGLAAARKGGPMRTHGSS